MAVTKRMPKVLKSQTSVARLIQYILNPEKTEDEMCIYAESVNCALPAAAKQFETVRQMWDKDSGNLAYHFIQSFAPGELTPEEAFECGRELAEVLFGNDGYQVVFAEHLDREHLHNHFCVNAVNQLNGKKLQTDHAFIRRMRSENDRICRLHNLSVITEPSGNGKTYAEWIKDKNGGFTWRGSIRHDIDALIPTVGSFKELLTKLSDSGYTVAQRGKYLRLSPPGTDTYFRFCKLGYGYTEEELTDKILFNGNTAKPKPYIYSPQRKKKTGKLRGNYSGIRKGSRLAGMYYVYLSRLRGLYRSPSARKFLPVAARQDMQRLGQLADDMFLIRNNHISDSLELSKLYYSLDGEIKELCNKRTRLRTELAAADGIPAQMEIRQKIDGINSVLPTLRKKKDACERIYERSRILALQSKELAQIRRGKRIGSVGKTAETKEKNPKKRKEDCSVGRS